jgi:hypothetical protein
MQRFAICLIPRGCSRHNAPGRPHAIADLVRANKGSGDVTVLLLNEDPATTNFSSCCAVARAFPTYTFKKTTRPEYSVKVYVQQPPDSPLSCFSACNLAKSIQLCQKLVGEWL